MVFTDCQVVRVYYVGWSVLNWAFLEAILMEVYFFCVAYQQVGDLIETYLVQIRDIDKVMKSAKTGSVKERRNAAFELASLAATGDDTKFRIVQEGG